VVARLPNAAGTSLGRYTVSRFSGVWSQATQPFLNTGNQTAMDARYATVTVRSGSGVFAFTSVIDNITNNPTTVAMQK
jgi:hypothetical protein